MPSGWAVAADSTVGGVGVDTTHDHPRNSPHTIPPLWVLAGAPFVQAARRAVSAMTNLRSAPAR